MRTDTELAAACWRMDGDWRSARQMYADVLDEEGTDPDLAEGLRWTGRTGKSPRYSLEKYRSKRWQWVMLDMPGFLYGLPEVLVTVMHRLTGRYGNWIIAKYRRREEAVRAVGQAVRVLRKILDTGEM